MRANEELRLYAKEKKVRFWEVAEILNTQEATLSRMMRHELENKTRERIISIIDKIASERTA